MLQDHPENRDLYIVIGKCQGKIEKDGNLVEDGKKYREGSPQCKMDEGKEENEVSQVGYGLHSTPNRMDEKQSSGEIPKCRILRTS